MTLINLINVLRENPVVKIFYNIGDNPSYEMTAEEAYSLPISVLKSRVKEIFVCEFTLDIYICG